MSPLGRLTCNKHRLPRYSGGVICWSLIQTELVEVIARMAELAAQQIVHRAGDRWTLVPAWQGHVLLLVGASHMGGAVVVHDAGDVACVAAHGVERNGRERVTA